MEHYKQTKEKNKGLFEHCQKMIKFQRENLALHQDWNAIAIEIQNLQNLNTDKKQIEALQRRQSTLVEEINALREEQKRYQEVQSRPKG